jgi:WD40 repeat protein
MPTQRVIYTMAGHVSSLKQTRFQPGSASVIATCSRDGSVQIWDLRCKGFDAPVQKLCSSLDGESASRLHTHNDLKYARSTNTIFDAHASRQPLPAVPLANPKLPSTSSDAPSKTESPSRRGDVSITAVSFLPGERSHLLLTASEANATVKLWDLRTTHNPRSGRRATPLSSTRQPDSHNRHRHFGLTSLALSTDGARLYTLCRDNTIYTYSTPHLILGSAPELSLSASSSRPRRSGGGTEKQGLGPIYGFRHPKFHATTFYVKAAIRPTSGANTELLAVGSSDGCAVLFPTDERYMRRPPPSRSTSPPATRNAPRLNDTIPIYTHGAALVRGHSREVTGLTWMPGGELVSVGDDFRARCWREDAQGARGLRVGGEGEGRRWGMGWAEVEGGWDEDED